MGLMASSGSSVPPAVVGAAVETWAGRHGGNLGEVEDG